MRSNGCRRLVGGMNKDRFTELIEHTKKLGRLLDSLRPVTDNEARRAVEEADCELKEIQIGLNVARANLDSLSELDTLRAGVAEIQSVRRENGALSAQNKRLHSRLQRVTSRQRSKIRTRGAQTVMPPQMATHLL